MLVKGGEKMTPIEILAVIFAVVILVRAVAILVKPKKFIKLAVKVMENKPLVIGISVVTAVIIGYFAITALGVVNVFVASMLGIALVGFTLMMYPKLMVKITRAVLKDRKKLILPLIVWVAFAVWVLYTLFA